MRGVGPGTRDQPSVVRCPRKFLGGVSVPDRKHQEVGVLAADAVPREHREHGLVVDGLLVHRPHAVAVHREQPVADDVESTGEGRIATERTLEHQWRVPSLVHVAHRRTELVRDRDEVSLVGQGSASSEHGTRQVAVAEVSVVRETSGREDHRSRRADREKSATSVSHDSDHASRLVGRGADDAMLE